MLSKQGEEMPTAAFTTPAACLPAASSPLAPALLCPQQARQGCGCPGAAHVCAAGRAGDQGAGRGRAWTRGGGAGGAALIGSLEHTEVAVVWRTPRAAVAAHQASCGCYMSAASSPGMLQTTHLCATSCPAPDQDGGRAAAGALRLQLPSHCGAHQQGQRAQVRCGCLLNRHCYS